MAALRLRNGNAAQSGKPAASRRRPSAVDDDDDDDEALRRRVEELELENALMREVAEVVKKDPGDDLRRLPNREKTLLIDRLRPAYSPGAMTCLPGIAPGGCHYHHARLGVDKYAGLREKVSRVFAAFKNRRQVNPAIHQRMTDLFHEYLIVGGMPAAVSAFAETHNVQQLRMQQQSIVDQYRRDISQYADNLADARSIRRIFDLVPAELNQQNKRFRITQVAKGARLSREEDRFLWLADAGVALPVCNVDEPRYPLMLSMNSRLFKLFLNDVGLLACMCGMEVIRDLLNDRTDINYGALYENVVAQELKAHGFNLFYLENNSIGELDFVIEYPHGYVQPIEVKSGKSYKRHSALTKALNTENFGIRRGMVLAETNTQYEGNVDYLPIYMVSQLHNE